MRLITSREYQVTVAGQASGWTRLGQGLLQGDPSFPFLFNVVFAFILQDLVMDWIGRGCGFQLRAGVRCVLQVHADEPS
eukprot:4834471-Amphidinium_carterae.1